MVDHSTKREELISIKCKYCGDKYKCDPEYADYRACPDCFDRYYNINISGEIILKDVPWLGNDISYRKELQPVTHRGKYQNLEE